jgi:hypothetical protein
MSPKKITRLLRGTNVAAVATLRTAANKKVPRQWRHNSFVLFIRYLGTLFLFYVKLSYVSFNSDNMLVVSKRLPFFRLG